ncbi:hypothetical protein AWB77_04554 [Caballeronia fortuita]|uniref:Uncharacterized protein n=1 Tax=Caballeronia fortuita TaxID=1777138 RepID=A0A158CUI4_9BURK|nr:hypothetical protein [Caballeronia fortuita]SAK85984.1 hypothetical protein AWB77_04554 [Caballeronia fortuita]
MTKTSVSTVRVLMSFFALRYVALLSDAEHIFAAHPEATALVEK